ncbi:MAG: ATP-binding protein [Methylococcaceae bacterium]|nr:ATP-binding protein [Methylococcaceae bacterium]
MPWFPAGFTHYQDVLMSPFQRSTPLPCDWLTVRADPAELPFASTATLEPYSDTLGQERAREAIAFGVDMVRPGYNIYVMGVTGTGRLSLARNYLEQKAGQQPSPADWVYLYNFAEPREPVALGLPAGLGKTLLADMENLVDGLIATFPAAFENPAYQRGKAEVEREFSQRYDQVIDQVERRARGQNIALFREGDTISFSPMLGDKTASEEEFAAFAEQDKESFHQSARALEAYLTEALVELPQWKRETGERLRRLNRETIGRAITPLLAPLQDGYVKQPEVLAYLGALREDLPHMVAEQLLEERQQDSSDEAARRALLVERYAPKLLVSHGPGGGAPVICEANPSYQNLFGRIEYSNEQGVPLTHHRLICAGALHRANGGYLLLEADKLAQEAHVWPALKRALKSRSIRIESPFLDPSAPLTVSLNPQPIPLALKVVLVGDRELYYLMQELDDEFNELFRVLADFDDHLPRDGESMLLLVRRIKAYAACSGFADLSAEACVRLIEYSGRLAEHRQRLSARIGDLFELTAEADSLRRQQGLELIGAEQIEQALSRKEQRLGRISRLLLEAMLDGTLLIATSGEAVGRINGLTVLEVGDSRFGSPARITATVSPGGRGVIDIEREVRLGQAIHSKGVMILAGFLARQYARDFPLAISANIALEQSYGYVDGDSASLAEVLALISALTDVPIRQTLAVTGSINQYGDVQAVGGVNEKIEGFFTLCQARGLNGEQGVVIPQANVANLMLDAAVVEAAGRGEFAIYPVASVDQALALLTGKPVQAVNRLASSRLRSMAKWVK